MKHIKLFENYLVNEDFNIDDDDFEYDENDDIMDFLLYVNNDLSLNLMDKILNNNINVKKYDKNHVLYNDKPIKIGRFIKKIYPDISPKNVENISSSYKLFFSEDYENELNGWIAVNISKWELDHKNIQINSYPVTDQMSRAHFPDFILNPNPNEKIKKLHGYINNEIRNLNKYIKPGIIDYLQRLNYKFTIKDQFQYVVYYILYFNNEKDIFKFIKDFKNY